MRFSTSVFGIALAASPIAAEEAKTLKVDVGANGALTYNPNNFEATVGSKIEFHYFPKNHSVTQSSFKDPCHPLEGGFFSGFVNTTDSPSKTTFTIEVKDTKPIWFYCGQANHCQKGMIGAINAPKTGNTFDAFAKLAVNATNSTSPSGGPAGGVLSNGGSQSGSSSSVASTAVTTKPYTSTWTSNGQTFTTTATTTIFAGGAPPPAQSTWAYTTKPVTSTWTSNGQTFTTTATQTLLTTATVGAGSTGTTSSSQGAAAVATGSFNVWQAGALVVGVAALM